MEHLNSFVEVELGLRIDRTRRDHWQNNTGQVRILLSKYMIDFVFVAQPQNYTRLRRDQVRNLRCQEQ